MVYANCYIRFSIFTGCRSPETVSARLPSGCCHLHGPVHTTMDRSMHGAVHSEQESVLDGKQQQLTSAALMSSSDTPLRPRAPLLSPRLGEKRPSNTGKDTEYLDDRRKNGEPATIAEMRGARGKTGKDALRDSPLAGSKPGMKSTSAAFHFNSSSAAGRCAALHTNSLVLVRQTCLVCKDPLHVFILYSITF